MSVLHPPTAAPADLAVDQAHLLHLLMVIGEFGSRTTAALAHGIGDEELVRNIPVLLLADLALHGQRRPTDLMRVTGLTSGGITKQLDRLERAGLIARTFGQVAGDRRAIVVSLTPDGMDVARRLSEAFRDSLAVSGDIVGELIDALEQVRTGVGDRGGIP
jgi:DNA-binding MarR family transcriptional regulator